MLETLLRDRMGHLLAPPAAKIAAWGISADSLTAVSFVLGVGALPDIGHQAYLSGLGLMVLGRMFDIADGAVARIRGSSSFGTYLDRVLDLVWTSAVPFAFALAQPDRALAAMFLLLGLVARAAALTGIPRPQAASAATALGLGATLIGKTEVLIVYALACIFPAWFSILAYVLGMLCFVMAGFGIAAASAKRT